MAIQSADRLIQARDYLRKVLGDEAGILAYSIAFHVNADRKGKRRSTIASIAGKGVYRNLSEKQVNYLSVLVGQEINLNLGGLI